MNEQDQAKEFVDNNIQALAGTLTESVSIAAENFVKLYPHYLYFGKDDWLKYNGAFWEQATSSILASDVMVFVSSNRKLKHPRQIAFIVQCIGMLCPAGKLQLYGSYRRKDNLIYINFPDDIAVVDARSGIISRTAHDKEMMFTSCVANNYDAKADYYGNEYRTALKEILPNKEDRILWRCFLCSIFDPTQRLECSLVLYGEGSNGKSTVLEWTQFALGDDNVSVESLSDLTGDKHQRAAYSLKDKMLNIFMEHEDISIGSMAVMRSITSGESMMAEEKWKPREKIRPSTKCVFGLNHHLRISNPVYADLRRFRFIVFTQIFDESSKNSNIKEAYKTDKIARQIIAYALNYMPQYLKIENAPYGSATSKAEYDLLGIKADTLHYFITELCISQEGGEITTDTVRVLLREFLGQHNMRNRYDKLEPQLWKKLKRYGIRKSRPGAIEGKDRPRYVQIPRESQVQA